MDDDAIVWTLNSVHWAAHHYPAVHAFWLCREFFSNPELRARLLDEQAEHPTLDARAVERMELLRGCVLEALRLHPLAVLPRLVKQDLEFRGMAIPAGSVVACSPHLGHHDEEVWPDAKRFDPDRWGQHAERARPALSFFPGGGGRWGCVGIRLTVSMLTALWAHLLRTWDFDFPDALPPREAGPMLMPPSRPVAVHYRRRTPKEVPPTAGAPPKVSHTPEVQPGQ
jgi:cytochrome P450